MTLVNILLGIGMFFLVLCLFIYNSVGDVVKGILFALSSFFVGLAGIVITIKKEVNYTIINFYDFPAVLIGIVAMLAGFFTSSMFLVAAIRSLSK